MYTTVTSYHYTGAAKRTAQYITNKHRALHARILSSYLTLQSDTKFPWGAKTIYCAVTETGLGHLGKALS